MKQHVSKVSAASFYHLHRPDLTTHWHKSPMLALITSRLDYCNALSTIPYLLSTCSECCSMTAFQRQAAITMSATIWSNYTAANTLATTVQTQHADVWDHYRQVFMVQPDTSSHPGLRSVQCPDPKFVRQWLGTKFSKCAFSYAGETLFLPTSTA